MIANISLSLITKREREGAFSNANLKKNVQKHLIKATACLRAGGLLRGVPCSGEEGAP